jgi:hypothetical protein
VKKIIKAYDDIEEKNPDARLTNERQRNEENREARNEAL